MAKQKEDATKATHFMVNHPTLAFEKGRVVAAEELGDAFGRNEKHSDEQHEKYRAASLKRLLDLGAITPAEAPEEPDEAAEAEAAAEAAKKAEEKRKADEDAARKAAVKHPEPPKK